MPFHRTARELGAGRHDHRLGAPCLRRELPNDSFDRARFHWLTASLVTMCALLCADEAAALECDIQFEPSLVYAAGANAHALVVRDLNADGILDIAVANGGGSVTVHRGLGSNGVGNGSFAAAVTYAVPGQPFAIVSADVNADGAPDLVTANVSAGTVSVLLGQGVPGPPDGTFAPLNSYSAGSAPFALTSADFNRDGMMDLAVANFDYANGGVSILLGRGDGGIADGSFAAPVTYRLGCRATDVAAADFDADGILDLAVTMYDSAKVGIMHGNGAAGMGDGTFSSRLKYPAGPFPFELKAHDFDHDGILDLVVATYSGAMLVSGLGNAASGDGTFGPPVPVVSQNCISIDMGDFDGDQVTDIATLDGNHNTLAVVRGLSTGGVFNGRFELLDVRTIAAVPYDVVAADFNGDGRQDLAVVTYESGNLTILLDHVPSGEPPPQTWIVDGRPLAAVRRDQLAPQVATDDHEGAIVVWQDQSSRSIIRAQRVTRTGRTLWQDGGVPICADGVDQTAPRVVSDGQGGAWIGFLRYAPGLSAALVLQRINASGKTVASSPCPGLQISESSFWVADFTLASDGAGGVFIAYMGTEPPYSGAIYCQHLDQEGLPPVGWPDEEGVSVSLATPYYGYENDHYFRWYYRPVLRPDGVGGAIITWLTYHDWTCGRDVWHYPINCTQWETGTARVMASGAVAYTNDIMVSAQEDPYSVPAGGGAQLLVSRLGSQIIGRRIEPTGSTTWAVSMCSASGSRVIGAAIPSDSGGVIAFWVDRRSGNWDLYALRLNADGSRAAGWPQDGLAVVAGPGDQVQASVHTDADGVMSLCWVDNRAGNYDIYGTQLDRNGVPLANWPEGGMPLCTAAGDQLKPVMVPSGDDGAIVAWEDARCGSKDIFAQRMGLVGSGSVAVDPTTARPALDLGGAWPNPARGFLRVSFSLADDGPAKLELFDIAGRRVVSRPVGSLGPGSHLLNLSERASIAPGFYVLRLRAGDRSLTKSVLLTR